MLRSLLSCLWPRSRPEPRPAEEIQDDLRGSLARRRHLAEKIVEEGEVRAELASTLDGLTEEFERRVDIARLGPGLVEGTHEEICRKCWTGEEYPWYGPSPGEVSLALLDSQHRLIVRRESLEVVHQKVCSLQDEFAEAVKRDSRDLHFGREQLDAEVFLPPEPLKTIDEVHYNTASASVEPNVIDWDARIDAARQKFRASSARVHQAMEEFDRRLIEPMKERCPYFGVPPPVSDRQDEGVETQFQVLPQLHDACETLLLGLVFPEAVTPVEYATALVVTLMESATGSVSLPATVDHASASEQNGIRGHARLEVARQRARAAGLHVRHSFERFSQELRALGAGSLRRVTSLRTRQQPDSA